MNLAYSKHFNKNDWRINTFNSSIYSQQYLMNGNCYLFDIKSDNLTPWRVIKSSFYRQEEAELTEHLSKLLQQGFFDE